MWATISDDDDVVAKSSIKDVDGLGVEGTSSIKDSEEEGVEVESDEDHEEIDRVRP